MSYFALTLQAGNLNLVAAAEMDPREGTEGSSEREPVRVLGGKAERRGTPVF